MLIFGLLIGKTFFSYTGRATTVPSSNLNGKYVPGEIIVKFKTGDIISMPAGKDEASIKNVKINKKAISDLSKKYKVDKVKKFANKTQDKYGVFAKVYMFKMPVDVDAPNMAGEYANDSSVEYAQANFYTQSATDFTPVTPNDPYFPQQWNLKRMKADLAWSYSQGYYDNGSSVLVGVVDSGINYNIPDLAANYIGGYDYDSESGGDDSDPMDRDGHGTGVCSILAASANNGQGMAGACPGCKLYVVKQDTTDQITDTLIQYTIGNVEDLARGIVKASDAGARVISVSQLARCEECGWLNLIQNFEWCTKVHCGPVEDAVSHVYYDRGGVVVAAAGNEGDSDPIPDPAWLPPVITVGATDQLEGRSIKTKADGTTAISNYGRHLDVAAPGSQICVFGLGGDVGCGGIWMTSGATPQVSALAALLIAKKPDLKNYEVTRIIKASTDPTNAGVPLGTGRVNYARAMSYLNYEVVKNESDYNSVFQRCCVANVGQSEQNVSWRHDSSTTDYTILKADSTVAYCPGWTNYCSAWNTTILPATGRGGKILLRFWPGNKIFLVYPGITKSFFYGGPYGGLKLKLGRTEDAWGSLANITYMANLPPGDYGFDVYQWDLAWVYGTVDADKDGWYANANIKDAIDCNDDVEWIRPATDEFCGNYIDDNCNGFIDEVKCEDRGFGGTGSGEGGGGGVRPILL